MTNPPREQPLVSVIMAAYNAGSYLRPAIESILEQTYTHWELLIVDDGSSDGSLATVSDIRDPRVFVLSQENRGKPAALNRALLVARGEFYALQDADDISHPERLARQVSAMLDHPQVAGVFCGHSLILRDRVVAPRFRPRSIDECARDIAHETMPAHDPTGMYRMSLVRDIQYAEDLPVVEGFDYIMRVGEQFPLVVIGEPLYHYRVHQSSVTRRDPSRRNRLHQELFDRLRRRRGQPRKFLETTGNALRDADNDIVSHFTASVADQVLAGRRRGAVQTGLASWRLHPTHPYYFKPFLYSLTPQRIMASYRARRESA